MGSDTLLGPEETDHPVCLIPFLAFFGGGGFRSDRVCFLWCCGLLLSPDVFGGWWGCCLFFENCTVDASIFLFALVFKFLRAHGGCLGIRSR